MTPRLRTLATVTSLLLLGSAGLVLPVSAQLGDAKEGDARVRRLLEELEMKWTIDKDGDFRLHNEVTEDRSQLIWVLSNTSDLRNLEVREVWSIGFKSAEPFSAEIARRLLTENTQTKVGAWQMRKMGEEYVAVFSAQIAANTDAETLQTIIDAVATTADEMELDVVGTDDW